MSKVIPIVIIGAAAAAAVAIIRKRNKQEEASIVSLEDLQQGTPNVLQPQIDSLVFDAKQILGTFTGADIKLVHSFSFENEDRFFDIVRRLKENGYSLDDVGELSALVSKVIAKDNSVLETELKSVYDLITANQGLYKSFQLENV